MRKNEKKQNKWLLWASLLATLLTAFLVFNFVVQIRFLIHDELQVEISPIQSIIHTNKDKFELNFTVGVNTFKFCRSICKMDLVDAYFEKTIDARAVEINHRPVVQRYEVAFNFSKSGERVYYLYVSCHNEKSFMCKTGGDEKSRSAILTIERDYAPEEAQTKNFTKKLILEKFLEIKRVEWEESKFNELVSLVNHSIKTAKNRLNETYNLSNRLNKSIDAYSIQRFLYAQKLLNFTVPEINLSALLQEIDKYNEAVNWIKNNSNELENAFDYYYRINNSCTKILNISFLNFEKIASLNYSKLNECIYNYPQEKNYTEMLLWEKLRSQARLLNASLSSELCKDTQYLQNLTQFHNSHILSGGDITLLAFINTSIYDATENQTHIIVGNNSKAKTQTLFEYLEYLRLPEISTEYCVTPPPLQINYKTIMIRIGNFSIPSLNLPEPKRFCCIYGSCEFCQIDKKRYPIVFIHGHALNKADPPESSINSFSAMQKKLSDEELIVNAGDIDYKTQGSGYWSEMPQPIGVRATYYYVSYYDANSLRKAISKDEGIENYAIRLKELIQMVLNHTGADKVIIVSHSMGGLVAREYLMLFGDDKVDRLIMIATPNHGVSGKVAQFCGYLGNQRACEDMTENSIFLKKLNSFTPKIPITVIIGTGCDVDGEDGDGIVKSSSATLNYAKNIFVNVSCEGLIGARTHSQIIYPDIYPETYGVVKRILFTESKKL